jgi:hypothetical protein
MHFKIRSCFLTMAPIEARRSEDAMVVAERADVHLERLTERDYLLSDTYQSQRRVRLRTVLSYLEVLRFQMGNADISALGRWKRRISPDFHPLFNCMQKAEVQPYYWRS